MSDQPNSEVAPLENATAEREISQWQGYDPDMDFRHLALDALYQSRGFRLVDKEALIGVPFVVVGITYRPGIAKPGTEEGDYVSVECVVADKDTLLTPPVQDMLPADLRVFGNEPVVFNDGSTGVRRTITELLQTIGLIAVGTGKNKDEYPFDRPFQIWDNGQDRATAGFTKNDDEFGGRGMYVALRGLRLSEYPNPAGGSKPSQTYYFA